MNYIYMDGTTVAMIGGTEAAYEAFTKACDFAAVAGVTVDLVDGETGEVVASYNFFDED